MAKDLRIDTGSRPRQLPPEAHIRMHFEKFSSFVEEYSSKLSLGGMFVATREPRPVGSEVAFDLKLADGFRLVHGHGEVAWVRLQEGGPGRPAGMALRFVALDEKGRGLVLKVLEEQLKAGGLPFEIDPPPADAILDYSGPPSPRQIPLPLQPALDEEPTLITPRRRSLDETGFDAPWGQKLPEVPTDLLDDSEAGPSVPKVSEVRFAADAAQARPAPPPAGGPGAPSSLFAAAFPGQSARNDSPVDLGFVLDEGPLGSPNPAPADFAWNTPDPFAPGAIAATEDPEIDFGHSPGDIPFDPDPADLAMPSFDSEEPTLLGKTPVFFGEEEPTVVGSRQSVLPAVGRFEVGPPAPAFGSSGFEVAPAAAAFEAPAFEPSAFEAPAFEPSAFEPSAFEPPPAFGEPAFEVSAFEAPAFGSPAPAFEAPAWESAPAPAYLPPAPTPSAAAFPVEPFADARPLPPPNLYGGPQDLSQFAPMASAPPPPVAPSYGSPGFSPGYFDGSGVASPPDTDPYDPNEDWAEEPEPSRGARIKAALSSRKAIVGLALTAALVTGAYFLAGDLLGGKEEMPLAAGPPANRPQPPAARPDPAPVSNATADPEQVVATSPDEQAPAVAMPSRSEPTADSRGPADTSEPTRTEPARTEPTRAEPARTEPARRSTGSARHLLRAEARKTADSTIVELFFDGEVDPGLVAHDSFTWTDDRERITFKGLDRPRQDLLRVGSPHLKAVRFSWANEGQTAVFDVPVGARISSVTPEGNQVRVVLVR